jgi:hypothetical protein
MPDRQSQLLWHAVFRVFQIRYIPGLPAASLSGQVKSGQWWSGQKRPTDVARDVILLAHFLLVRQVRFRAPAPWPAFQDVPVV